MSTETRAVKSVARDRLGTPELPHWLRRTGQSGSGWNCADRANVRGVMKNFGRFGVALVATVWLLGGGGLAVAATPASRDPALSAALKAWASFPVRAHPRELVLTGDQVVAGGFPSN